MLNVFVKKLSEDAIIPSRSSEKAVGSNLHSILDYSIPSGGRAVISTGLGITLGGQCYARIAPKMRLTVDHGIQVGAGVIDHTYQGELKVVLFNHGEETFEVKKGDVIAQILIESCVTAPFEEDFSEPPDTM